MRIVFMGTSGFGLPALRLLLKKEYEIISVVTVPDKPAGRGRKLHESPVKTFAKSADLPVLQPGTLGDPWFIETLKKLRPELFVVVAFRILPPAVFTIPSFGSINLHASLLPKYRGAAPINWAVISGERETGLSTFFLEEGVDTGDLILQKRISIGDDETAGELHDRLSEAGADIVRDSVQMIATRKVTPVPQDASRATPAPKIFRKDCRIDWNGGTSNVHNFIRGLSPKPGAFFHHGTTVLKVFRSVIARQGRAAAAGTVTSTGDRLVVSCGDGSVELTELQQEGKKTLRTAEFLRGYGIREGEVLT